jgi:hypothetical protein
MARRVDENWLILIFFGLPPPRVSCCPALLCWFCSLPINSPPCTVEPWLWLFLQHPSPTYAHLLSQHFLVKDKDSLPGVGGGETGGGEEEKTLAKRNALQTRVNRCARLRGPRLPHVEKVLLSSAPAILHYPPSQAQSSFFLFNRKKYINCCFVRSKCWFLVHLEKWGDWKRDRGE